MPWRLLGASLAWITLAIIAVVLGSEGQPGDAVVYFNAHGEHLYSGPVGTAGYAYSPAFAQAIAPLQALPFETFRAIVAGAELWALGFLLGPWWTVGIMLAGVWPIYEGVVTSGNIQLFATAMLVLALRYPAVWPASFLIKLTPGIGILWPLFRREWRNVIIGVGLTAAIALVSFAAAPHHWFEWIAWMTGSVDASADRPLLPLSVRVVAAVVLLAWAARTDRIWLVPIAAALASPEGSGHWLLALGALPLWLKERQAPTP